MSNWVYNTLLMEGIEKMPYYTDEGQFDLNKVIPMPEDLNIKTAPEVAIAVYLLNKKMEEDEIASLPYWKRGLLAQYVGTYVPDDNKERLVPTQAGRAVIKGASTCSQEELDQLYEDGERCVCNIVKYGYPSGYEWKKYFWGTLWTSDTKIMPGKILFDTKGMPPLHVVHKMSIQNPGKTVTINWSDEGRTAGTAVFIDGKCIDYKEGFIDENLEFIETMK